MAMQSWTEDVWLNDNDVNWALQFFCGLRDHAFILYIDSAVLAVAMNQHTRDDALRKLGVTFNVKLQHMQGIIIPLSGNNHWSLLYFCASRNKLYHYDSKTEVLTSNSGKMVRVSLFHRQQALAAATFLKQVGVIPMETTFASLGNYLPIQPSSWECGYFTVLFAFMLVRDRECKARRTSTPISNFDFETFALLGRYNMRFPSQFRMDLKDAATTYRETHAHSPFY
jgi:Ulp1 family protease